MNRRGVIGIILFFSFLFLILILGFIAAMAIGIIDFTSDTITPIMTDLGVVGETNVSEAAEFTFGTVDNIVQALPWLVGMMYVLALISSVIFVISYGQNPHPVYIGFYFSLVILLIFGSIVMSNMYEDFYLNGGDEIGSRLREQTLLSYMILYSPFILALIALLTGIYLFAKPPEGGGGFGI